MKSYRTTTDQQYPTHVFYCLSIFQKVTMVKEDRKKTKGGEESFYSTSHGPNLSPTAAAPLQLGCPQQVLSSTCQVLTTSCIRRSAGHFAVLHCHASVNVFFYTRNLFFLNDVPPNRGSHIIPAAFVTALQPVRSSRSTNLPTEM